MPTRGSESHQSPNERNAQQIMVSAGDKLRWLESIAFSSASTSFDARVAIALSNRINKYTALITIDQVWLAAKTSATVRGVRKALTRLIKGSYLKLEKPSSGPGRANVYRPILPASVQSGNPRSASNKSESRNHESVKPERPHLNTDPSVPTLPPHYQHLSQRRTAEAIETNLISDPTNKNPVDLDWGHVKKELANMFGSGVVVSWFDKIAVVDITSDSVVMAAPNKFVRDYVDANYLYNLTEAWHRVLPTVKRVQVVCSAPK
jgi:hypothetical protein